MDTNADRWVVTGASGMLGRDMVAVLEEHGHHVTPLSRSQVDITDVDAVREAVAGAAWVVNCAAYTDVDGAEGDEEAAIAVNATGAGVVARECADAGARLVHISTDYVFAGEATTPYAEDDPTDARTAYGRSKAAGEREVLAARGHASVVRTAWLYGAGGSCFPRTIARAGAERGALDVVDDQHGQPTWTRDVAEFVLRLTSAAAPPGIYHATSSDHTTWYEFARAVTASAGLGDIVSPTTSDAFVRPAPRPAWSVLGHEAALRAGVEPIGPWRERWHAAASSVLA